MKTQGQEMRDLLYEMYVNQKLNSREIAQKIGEPQRTVLRWLHAQGIPVQRKIEFGHLQLRDRKWLWGEYITKRKSTIVIAREIGAGSRTVYEWLLRHSIRIRSIGEAQKGKIISAESRFKMSLAKKGKYIGPAHWGWKGDRVNPELRERRSHIARKWRRLVRERDKHKCAQCGSTKRLHIHHILPFKDNIDRRWDLSNGITLCALCHEKVHGFTFPNWVTGKPPKFMPIGELKLVTVRKQVKFEPSSAELEGLYREWSIARIAKHYGVNAETVRKQLHKYQIPVRNVGEKRTLVLNKEELQGLYQEYSMKHIAQIYGVGETLIWKRIHEFGILLEGVGKGGHRKKKGKIFSNSHRKALSVAHKGLQVGNLHPNWRGGEVVKICVSCRKQFSVVKARGNTAIFCSRKCRFLNCNHLKVCAACGKDFAVIRSRKETAKFCSRACKAKVLRYNPIASGL